MIIVYFSAQCVSALGMQSDVIKDVDLTASSSFEIGNVGPQNARWVQLQQHNTISHARLHAKRIRRAIFFFFLITRLLGVAVLLLIIDCWTWQNSVYESNSCYEATIVPSKWPFSLFCKKERCSYYFVKFEFPALFRGIRLWIGIDDVHTKRFLVE